MNICLFIGYDKMTTVWVDTFGMIPLFLEQIT